MTPADLAAIRQRHRDGCPATWADVLALCAALEAEWSRREDG